MKRLVSGLAGVAVLALAAFALRSAAADKDEAPSISEIMTKAHKGGNSLIQKVGKQLKEKDVPWADVQKETDELVGLGKSLSKNKPPKGAADNWEKLTMSYVKDAESLDKAADDKDQKAAGAAHKKLTGSCKACHEAHRAK